MDDITLSGDLHTVEQDIITIIESFSETGLRLNGKKCEIITEDFTQINNLATFNDFIRVNKTEMTLLRAPVTKGKAQDMAIQHKIDDLSRALERLQHLHAHDALTILKNSLAIPKLLYLLRTSECYDNPLLSQFDDTLRTGLTTILNVDISEDQWLQASLPVGHGGLGIRSARMLAPSAFLASAASTLSLQQAILHNSIRTLTDQSTESAVFLDRSGQLAETCYGNAPHSESMGRTGRYKLPICHLLQSMVHSGQGQIACSIIPTPG